MHVDAFFEYLLDIPSPYWTDIPSSATLEDRDGVSPTDDMAIRALMPSTKPKRARKRLLQADEEDETPARPRPEWQPAGEASEASSPNPRQRRHGAKVLSSAWRSRGIGGSAESKPRGRPLAKAGVPEPEAVLATPHEAQVHTSPAATLSPPPYDMLTPGLTTSPPDRRRPAAEFSPTYTTSNSRRADTYTEASDSVLPSGVAPAWPPVTRVDYPHCAPYPADKIFPRPTSSPATAAAPPEAQTGYSYNLDAAEAARGTPAADAGFFDSFTDRTNLDATLAYIISVTKDADWYDVDGSEIPSCSVAESVAICNNMVEHLYNAAPSQSAFLINLAALLGARMIMTTTKVQMRRLGTQQGRTYYACSWEYRLGHLCGTYRMTHSIDSERLRREMGSEQPDGRPPRDAAPGEGEAVWRRRYEDTLRAMDEKDEELADLRARMFETLRK